MTNITAKTIKTTCEKRLKKYCFKLNNFVYLKELNVKELQKSLQRQKKTEPN